MTRVLTFDAVVVGSGVAGLSAALELAPLRTAVLTKGYPAAGGSSAWAQGGIAAAVAPGDSPALHAADTLAAGAGLNDPEAVRVLTAEGPGRVLALMALGADFDRTGDGALELGREAAHRRRRILHARGDATGAELMRALGAAATAAPHLTIFADTFAWDLAVDHGARGARVIGLTAIGPDGEQLYLRAGAVVLATGGCGRLFRCTTNPPEVTGDGLALAARAGALLADVELVQFHPTALAAPGADPLPLLTEALRGEGAVLVDGAGRRFMPAEHPDAELAPRDVVARAIHRRLAAGDAAYLDVRPLAAAVGEGFPERFPTVFELCRRHGLDPRRDPLPVSPAAHYHMGGVLADLDGRTTLPGLWACGEAAATGVHGANRLASNSLLEGLVFGARVAASIQASEPPAARPALLPPAPPAGAGRLPTSERGRRAIERLRSLAWEHGSVERDAAGLAALAAGAEEIAAEVPPTELGGEGRNLVLAARCLAVAALERTESRGGHHRSDYPDRAKGWRRRLALELAADGSVRSRSLAPALPATELPAAGELGGGGGAGGTRSGA